MEADGLHGLRLVHEHGLHLGGGAGRQAGALLPQQEVSAVLSILSPFPCHLLQVPPRPDWPVALATALVQAPPHVLQVTGAVRGEGGGGGGGGVAHTRD